MLQVFKPSFGDAEAAAVREVLESGWVGLGPRVEEFEASFAAHVGAASAVATNSGAAALHLACLALGIGPGDEVIVPALTFAATAHAVEYCGATAVFCDVEEDTLTLDVTSAERAVTANTRAIIPVHYGGHACRMDQIWDFADAHGLAVIEDAAHAAGSLYRGRPVGGLERTRLTAFSFHAVKNMTTGDGGMVTTHDPELDARLRRLRWMGIDRSTWDRNEEVLEELSASDEAGLARAGAPGGMRRYGWYYEVGELGYKYHMNDLAAAIGLVQLGRLEAMNARRRELIARYDAGFRGAEWIRRPVTQDWTRTSGHNYVVRTGRRDALIGWLHERDITTGVHYVPLQLQPYYAGRQHVPLPVTEREWPLLLTLPLYPDLRDDDVDRVVGAVLAFADARAGDPEPRPVPA